MIQMDRMMYLSSILSVNPEAPHQSTHFGRQISRAANSSSILVSKGDDTFGRETLFFITQLLMDNLLDASIP
jgi:hypothetical protein